MKRLFLTLFLLSMPSVAQVRDAGGILQSCALAMGATQHPHLQVIAEGELKMSNSDSRVAVLFKTRGLEDFRLERGNAGDAETSIISKGKGSHHGQAQKTAIPRHTVSYFRPDHLPALVCGNPARDGMRITYVGEETVGSRPAFHLKLDSVPEGANAHADAVESLISEYHIFIDQQSFTVLKTAKFVFSPESVDNRSLWETLYFDYRRVNGVLMPFRIQNLVAGHEFSITTFTNISTDVILPDQEFQEAQ